MNRYQFQKILDWVRKHGNPYAMVGVSQTSSVAEIQKAFRVKSRELHPDKCTRKDEESEEEYSSRLKVVTEQFKELSIAKDFLLNAQFRWCVDLGLSLSGGEKVLRPFPAPEPGSAPDKDPFVPSMPEYTDDDDDPFDGEDPFAEEVPSKQIEPSKFSGALVLMETDLGGSCTQEDFSHYAEEQCFALSSFKETYRETFKEEEEDSSFAMVATSSLRCGTVAKAGIDDYIALANKILAQHNLSDSYRVEKNHEGVVNVMKLPTAKDKEKGVTLPIPLATMHEENGQTVFNARSGDLTEKDLEALIVAVYSTNVKNPGERMSCEVEGMDEYKDTIEKLCAKYNIQPVFIETKKAVIDDQSSKRPSPKI